MRFLGERREESAIYIFSIAESRLLVLIVKERARIMERTVLENNFGKVPKIIRKFSHFN